MGRPLEPQCIYLQLGALAYVFIFVFAAQLMPDTYVWYESTVSELAAQDVVGREAMTFNLVLLAIVSFGVSVTLARRCQELPTCKWIMVFIPWFCFGIFTLGSAIWATVPAGVELNQEAKLHSFFATAAGFSFTIAMMTNTAILTQDSRFTKVSMVLFCAMVLFLILFSSQGPLLGLWQRLFQTTSLAYLIVVLQDGHPPHGSENDVGGVHRSSI